MQYFHYSLICRINFRRTVGIHEINAMNKNVRDDCLSSLLAKWLRNRIFNLQIISDVLIEAFYATYGTGRKSSRLVLYKYDCGDCSQNSTTSSLIGEKSNKLLYTIVTTQKKKIQKLHRQSILDVFVQQNITLVSSFWCALVDSSDHLYQEARTISSSSV